jgi:hypothetical protein
MEYNVLKVINLYKHYVVYKNTSKRNKFEFVAICVMFLTLTLLSFAINFYNTGFSDAMQTTVSYFKNPINPLYSDLGHIIFTSCDAVIYNTEKNVNLIVPVLSSKTTVNNDNLEFIIVDSIMVMASEDGVVEEVGTQANGQKFIKIKHSKSIETRYSNIDIAGVVPGEIVKSGQDIATAKVGEIVRFTVLKNGSVAVGLKINKNKVEWTN